MGLPGYNTHFDNEWFITLRHKGPVVDGQCEVRELAFAKHPQLVLMSTNRITGKRTAVCSVQVRSHEHGKPECNTCLIPKNETTKELLGGTDAFAAFSRDDAPVNFVLTNLVDEPEHDNAGRRRFIKIDLLAEDAPRDIVDYHDEHGVSTGVGINKWNEFRPLQSGEMLTDQRSQDAYGRHARLWLNKATNLATASGSATLSDEAALSSDGKKLGQSEMFITVTPSSNSTAVSLMDPAHCDLVWECVRTVLFDARQIRVVQTRSMNVEERCSVATKGPSRGYSATRSSDSYDGSAASFGIFQASSRLASRTDSLQPRIRGEREEVGMFLCEDTEGEMCAEPTSMHNQAGSIMVSNLSGNMAVAQHVNTSQTYATYDHAKRCKTFVLRLGVAGPSMTISNYNPQTVTQLIKAWENADVPLTQEQLIESIVAEVTVAEERAAAAAAQNLASVKTFKSDECVICMGDEEVDAILLPCLHQCMSRSCYAQLSEKSRNGVLCPLCRAFVSGTLFAPQMVPGAEPEDDAMAVAV